MALEISTSNESANAATTRPMEKMIPSTTTLHRKAAPMMTQPYPPSGGTTWLCTGSSSSTVWPFLISFSSTSLAAIFSSTAVAARGWNNSKQFVLIDTNLSETQVSVINATAHAGLKSWRSMTSHPIKSSRPFVWPLLTELLHAIV